MEKKLSEQVVEWVRSYMNSFGGNTKAVIGISGGKDSTIAAKICVEAIGPERVICVRLPQGRQHDLNVAREVCDYLGATSYEINIAEMYNTILKIMTDTTGIPFEIKPVFTSNTPARIRMTTLYGIAAGIGDARVVNTCNRSEDYIGYSTKFGDSAGDFSPLCELTVREVKQIGRELGIPEKFIEKVPEDGLSGKTDEDNLGFSYATLDAYLLENVIPDDATLKNIETRHRQNLHKITKMPCFRKDWE